MKKMKTKKYMKLALVFSVILFIANSCEEYLDKSPDQGITETEVYKDYDSFSGFLNTAYYYLDIFHGYNTIRNKFSDISAISDEMATVNGSAKNSPAISVNSGYWGGSSVGIFEIGNKSGSSISNAYKGLRIVNRIISDIDKVPNLEEQQTRDLLGQAYFLRAWFYYQLITRYGGMPKFDALYPGDGSEDLPRLTYQESNAWLMEDLDKALEYLPNRWDDDNVGRPDRIAALALKSEASLFAASPLMQNDLQTIEKKSYNKEECKIAAKNAQNLLDEIASHPEWNIVLKDSSEYEHIFYYTAPPYTQPEYLWANYRVSTDAIHYMCSFYLPYEYSGSKYGGGPGFSSPTQNIVDMFEAKGEDGNYYPISDSRSNYDPQKPYVNRDPRFYNNILYAGEKWGNNAQDEPIYISLYEGGSIQEMIESNSRTNTRMSTGYMCKKFIWEGADRYKAQWNLYRYQEIYIRLAEIYLNLAEASFEATGSATARVEGCTLSAEDAINIIRNRVGITNLSSDIVNNPEKFRKAYRRERAVELMFENKRWWDIRRWMIADELFSPNYPIKAMKTTLENTNGTTNQELWTYSHEIVDCVPEQRVFNMRNYWYPFADNDVAALNNLVQNPGW